MSISFMGDTSNITLVRTFSNKALKPRAPVFFTIKLKALSVKSKLTSNVN